MNFSTIILCLFLVGGMLIGSTFQSQRIKTRDEELSSLRNQNDTMRTQLSNLQSTQKAISEPESFHLLPPNALSLKFKNFRGELVWFTGNSGISYSQLNRDNDPGVEVSDGTITKPEGATAFMLKGKSENGWMLSVTTK